MKLQSEFSREFLKTIFARLPPLASATQCGPHPSLRLWYYRKIVVKIFSKLGPWICERVSELWVTRTKKLEEEDSAGLMPADARGNYLPEPPYLRETNTYHSQPLESMWHAGNYFVPISIRSIFYFCCRSYVKLLDYWRAENFFSTSGGPPEAWGPWHLPHVPHG